MNGSGSKEAAEIGLKRICSTSFPALNAGYLVFVAVMSCDNIHEYVINLRDDYCYSL